MNARLAGKKAVVVGGGQTEGETTGNGRAVALTFARAGAAVLVADRDLDAAEETADLIRGEGREAHACRADVTSDADCAALAATAIERLGGIDILHNNVGIVAPGSTEELPRERWQLALDVNLTGMWQTCKHFLPHLRAQRSGVVINISSLAGLAAAPPAIGYSTSKAAVNAMTRCLAIEYAPYGVRVNCIAPGLLDTPMAVDAVARQTGSPRDEVAATRAALVPIGRQGTAWDVANAALFLASDEAGFITGVILAVDGGSSLVTGSLPSPNGHRT